MLFSGINLIQHDIPAPDDSDLQLTSINIPKEQNAFYAFTELRDVLYWPQDEIDKKGGIDEELESKILQKNQRALEIFEKGVALPFFQKPEFQDQKYLEEYLLVNTHDLLIYKPLKKLAKINSIKATSLFRQGKEKEAFEQSLKTIKLAQMVQDGQGELFIYIYGLRLKKIGLENLRSLVNNSHLPSTDLINYINELNKYKKSKLALQKIWKVEYLMFTGILKRIMEDINRGVDSSEFLKNSKYFPKGFSVLTMNRFKPNKTKLLIMEHHRKLIDNTNKETYTEVDLQEKKQLNLLFLMFNDNAIGKALCNTTFVSSDMASEKRRFEAKFSVEGTRLLLALKAYKQDNGDLPNSLQDLVPHYISEPIRDPFDGNEVKYSRDKKIIYSTGVDLIDNSKDVPESNWQEEDDLRIKIEF